ncbi:MAG: hypothetical protein ABI402_00580 [Ferruginibacter sp.]
MTKTLFSILLLFLFLAGCKNKINKPKIKSTTEFKRFEISYSNGWTRGFAFLVNQDKIFIASNKSDTLQYGLLPDSINFIIDSFISKIKNDTSIKTFDDHCEDCAIVSLNIIFMKDTINVIQHGNIRPLLLNMVQVIDSFIKLKHEKISCAFPKFETQQLILPPAIVLPNRKKQILFTPPGE